MVANKGRWQSEMDRLMEGFFGPQSSRWGTGGPVNNFPPLNIWEDDDAYHVEAELPGLALEDIELFVKDREATISGKLKETAPQGAVVHRSERPTGEFKRELRLPMALDTNKVEARLVNGVLTLDLPKAVEAKGRRIEVKAG